MFTCLSPGNIGIKLSWEQCLPLAKESGFEGMDLEIDVARSASIYREKFAEFGLKVGGMVLPVDFRANEAKYKAGLAALPAIAARARETDLTRFYMWIWPFSDEMTMKENLEFHADRLGPCARVLADHGCRLGLEFLGPKTIRIGHRYPFVRTMEQMLDLCERVGLNCGLLLDSWHWHMSLGTVEDVLALRNEQVVYVHVNDAPAGIPVESQQDMVRRLPGDSGVIDINRFLGALRTIGYDGPVVPEPFDKELAKLPPEQAATLTGAAMRTCWE